MRPFALPAILAAMLMVAACADEPRRPRPVITYPLVSTPAEGAAGGTYTPRTSGAIDIVNPPPVTPPPQIFGGSAPRRPVRAEVRPGAREGDVTLNFVNADIREVIRAVLGEMLKLNYILDPRVQGQLTLQTNRPIRREAVIDVLSDVLRLNGFNLGRSGEVYSVTQGTAPAGGGSAAGPGGAAAAAALGPDAELQAVPLNYIAPDRMAEVLRSLAPAGTVIRPVPDRNLLLVGGRPAEVASLLDMVALFDVDAMAGKAFGLFYPRYAEARALARELSQVFDGGAAAAGAAQGRGGSGGGAIRFVPVERLNAVIAIAPSQAVVRDVASWVERLDRGAETGEARIFIYYVQNGRAADLARVLDRLFHPAGAAGSTGAAAPSASADAGYAEAVPPPAVPVPGMAGAPTAGVPGVSPLDGSLEGLGEGLAGDVAVGDQAAPQGPRIMADDNNNALLVLATPREYELVQSALGRLDVAPLQVLIEAAVAEVSLTDELRYGVQWFLRDGDFSLNLSNVAGGAVTPAFPGFAAVVNGGDIRVVLNALENVTDVHVVSSPRMMVLNNQTATLQVGDQVPVATQTAVSPLAPDAPLVNTIQFRDTGVILKVTPRVNESGLVRMDITQEVSDVTATTSSALNSPTIQQRKFTSSVSVGNGQTIALGGLIRDRNELGDGGIPLLKNLPGIGALFGSQSDASRRTELLVLITPHVVRSGDDIRRVTEELRRRLSLPAMVAP